MNFEEAIKHFYQVAQDAQDEGTLGVASVYSTVAKNLREFACNIDWEVRNAKEPAEEFAWRVVAAYLGITL